MNELKPSAEKALILSRCPACQLQLCKGRNEPAHAKLTEAATNGASRGPDRHFICQNCAITLINSTDLAKPGWRHHRQ